MPPQKARFLLLNWQSYILHRPPCLGRQTSHLKHAHLPAQRTLNTAPVVDTGRMMSRRSDRELPSVPRAWHVWARTLPIFIVIMTISALGIFNYLKSNSSVVAATLYALRTSEIGRRELGDEIYFRDKFPWIWGEINSLHGWVDIEFGVKGTKGRGMMKFTSFRNRRMGKFETKEWSLETEDGRKLQLLDAGREDPFKNTPMEGESKR